jgi:hypothetical protein
MMVTAESGEFPASRESFYYLPVSMGFELGREMQFKVGQLYTRPGLRKRLGLPERGAPLFNMGYSRVDKDFFVFCNVGSASRAGYDDSSRFDGGDLLWSARMCTSIAHAEIKALVSGESDVHIFYRMDVRDPYTYAGKGTATDVQNTSPVRLRWVFKANRFEIPSEIRHSMPALSGKARLIAQLLTTNLIATEDLVNLGYRKQQLKLFEELLADPANVVAYQKQYRLREDQPEAAWQHFFEHNEWIFGYGLDYRFQGILQSQFHASDTDADGSQAVISDFLLGDKRFTIFIEIKTPQTALFAKTQNRSRTWRLSTALMDSVSQILEQRAAGLLKFERSALHDSAGNLITQKAYDTKVILLIGHWDQLDDSANDRERETKQRTLELFRRDSRNIEILTYDELFERAKFIVEHREQARKPA